MRRRSMSTGYQTQLESIDLSCREQRIAELEREVEQLQDAVRTRQQIGVATGLIAARFGCSPERAWSVLVRLSQATNVKVRTIARVLCDAQAGQFATEDLELVRQLGDIVPVDLPTDRQPRREPGPTGSSAIQDRTQRVGPSLGSAE